MNHHFRRTDRGVGHVHRYTPECSCGWVGQHRPSIGRAKRSHADHVASMANQRRRSIEPRTATARAELPEALR